MCLCAQAAGQAPLRAAGHLLLDLARLSGRPEAVGEHWPRALRTGPGTPRGWRRLRTRAFIASLGFLGVSRLYAHHSLVLPFKHKQPSLSATTGGGCGPTVGAVAALGLFPLLGWFPNPNWTSRNHGLGGPWSRAFQARLAKIRGKVGTPRPRREAACPTPPPGHSAVPPTSALRRNAPSSRSKLHRAFVLLESP